MHPEIISDRAGHLPVCGMKLIPGPPERTVAAPTNTRHAHGMTTATTRPTAWSGRT